MRMCSYNFSGCKLALFVGSQLVVYKRDQIVGIPYPGLLDLPGGGRDAVETPEQCVLRELGEEFGLVIAPERLCYRREYSLPNSIEVGYFFAVDIGEVALNTIRFGDEGQYWGLIEAAEYGQHPKAIAHLQQLVLEYCALHDRL